MSTPREQTPRSKASIKYDIRKPGYTVHEPVWLEKPPKVYEEGQKPVRVYDQDKKSEADSADLGKSEYLDVKPS